MRKPILGICICEEQHALVTAFGIRLLQTQQDYQGEMRMLKYDCILKKKVSDTRFSHRAREGFLRASLNFYYFFFA